MSQARVDESISAISSGRRRSARPGRRRCARRGRGLRGGLVAAGAASLEVADHGVEHRLGEERRPGVVEVQHPLAPRCERPGRSTSRLGHRRPYRSDGVSDSGACRRTSLPSSSPTPPSRCASSSTSSGASTAGARTCGPSTRDRPRPAPDRAGLQGAPARDHLRGRPGLRERQPPEVPALLELPEPGGGVDRRCVPLLRRVRPRVGGHLEDAAVPGQGPHPQELLRVLPGPRSSWRPARAS